MIRTVLEKYPITTICLVVLLMLLPNLDVLNVTIMEARNFVTAREMILDDHWLLTTMNGEPRYQKPPLPTWLSALAALLFGAKSVFVMRLPSVIMVVLTGVYMFKLSKLFLPVFNSLINALIVITSFYVLGIIIEAPWDIFAHGFMLMGLYYLFQLFNAVKVSWKHVLFSGIFIGFSILSKGPVSLYVLLFSFLIAFGFSFKFKSIKTKIAPILTFIIIALVIGGWWYFYVRLEDPSTFKAIAERETGNWSSYNVRPFYYYWSFFTQSGIWTVIAFISLLYPYLRKKVIHKTAYKFSFLWTIIAVILLSVIPEKKSRYLMPVLIPLAINSGFYISYLIRAFKNEMKIKERIPVYFNFGLIAFLGLIIPFLGYFLFKDIIQKNQIRFLILAITLVIISISIIKFLKSKNMENVFYLTILFFISILVIGLPISKGFISDAYKPVNTLEAKVLEQQVSLYGYKNAPEAIWQYGNKIPNLKLTNEKLELPYDKKFVLLSSKPKDELAKLLPNNIKLELTETYNLNTASEESRQFKSRLISYFYIVKNK